MKRITTEFKLLLLSTDIKLKKETELFHEQISKTFLELYMPFVVLIGLIMQHLPEPINPT